MKRTRLISEPIVEIRCLDAFGASANIPATSSTSKAIPERRCVRPELRHVANTNAKDTAVAMRAVREAVSSTAAPHRTTAPRNNQAHTPRDCAAR